MCMEKHQLEKLIKEYIKENLTIETKECGGDYGSKKFLKIELILDGEEISTCYVDC